MKILGVYIQGARQISEIAEACFILSPKVSITEEALFIDVQGSEKIQSEEVILKRLKMIMEAYDQPYRWAWGQNCAEAFCLAKYQVDSILGLPVVVLFDYAKVLLQRSLNLSVLQDLEKLKVQSVADFLELPLQPLSSRFGEDLLKTYQALNGEYKAAWRPFYLKNQILIEKDLDYSLQIHNVSALLFLLNPMLDQLFLQLRARGEKVTEFQLNLVFEKFDSAKETPKILSHFQFSQPQTDKRVLREQIELKLEQQLSQRLPDHCYLEKIQLKVLSTVAWAGQQKNLLSKEEEHQEALDTLLARLSHRLSDEQVFFAFPKQSYLPEKSWQKKRADYPQSTWPFQMRPTRLLRSPLRLFRDGNYLMSQQRKWFVESYEGPENISSEWWDEQTERFYFKVSTKEGPALWIFTEQESQGADVFLHGYFD